MSMVEKVARAIWGDGPMDAIPWDKADTAYRTSTLVEARRAIEAMKTPTAAMRQAGASAINDADDDVVALMGWRAMIDAALESEDTAQ